MESKDNMDKISDHSYRISGGYAAEIDKASRLANIKGAIDNYHPQTSVRPDLNGHIQMFREFLQVGPELPGAEEILPETLLNERVEFIMTTPNLKSHFPAGYAVVLAILPFSINGNPLTEKEIKSGAYLRHLILEKMKVVGGFSAFPNYITSLMPPELFQAGFMIDQYDDPNFRTVTMSDRRRVAEKYTSAFRKLKELISRGES